MTSTRAARRGLLGAGGALALITAMSAAPSAAASASDPWRTIAVAEDERRWSDGVLRGFLTHADAAVRARAVLAVGRLQDSTSVPALLPLLADSSLDVRRETAFALGQIGHRSARSALEAQLGDRDLELRQLAFEALGKLGDHAATRAVARGLEDASPAIRGTAALALWRLADSTAVDVLLAREADADPGVRWRVLYALEKIPAPSKIVLRAALRLDDPDPTVRAFAARTIGRQRHVRGTAYLIGALDDAEPSVVVNALRSLQQIADSANVACARAIGAQLSHPNPYVRLTAATALAERSAWVRADSVTRARLLDSLTAHLADRDAATRGAAARALLARQGEGALARVQPLLADSSVYTRVAVLEGLRTGARTRPLRSLLEPLLAPSTGLFERMTAAEVLGERREAGAEVLLRPGLADTSFLFAASCATGLASLADTASASLLTRSYAARSGDAEPDARVAILDALRSLGRANVADSLERVHPPRHASRPKHDEGFERPPTEKGAVLHTSKGDIEWAFYDREAPQTVRNFVRLARRGYYNGLAVHRVVPNFVVQDGDPTGTGSGGPGYTIRCEYNRLHYDPGMVGMALAGKDTGGSQWFITHSPQLHLDGRYTIFARVVRGMDVVQRIVQGDRIASVEVLP